MDMFFWFFCSTVCTCAILIGMRFCCRIIPCRTHFRMCSISIIRILIGMTSCRNHFFLCIGIFFIRKRYCYSIHRLPVFCTGRFCCLTGYVTFYLLPIITAFTGKYCCTGLIILGPVKFRNAIRMCMFIWIFILFFCYGYFKSSCHASYLCTNYGVAFSISY